MDKEIDRTLAIHAMTMLEKQLAGIRTRVAEMAQVDVTSFNDMERMLVSVSLNAKATLKMAEMDFTIGSEIADEAKKWWKND